MGKPEDEPSPPSDVSPDLIDQLRRLDDHQLAELTRYVQSLLSQRTRPIEAAIRETEDPDRIVSIEDQGTYTAVERLDEEGGEPVLYHVTREHLPSGDTELRWTLIGKRADGSR